MMSMSSVRGPKRSARTRPNVRLDAVSRGEQVPRRQAGRHDEHRVQVVGLGRAAHRGGLVDGRDGQHVSVRELADGLHAFLKGTQPVAQVAADRQHRPRSHPSPLAGRGGPPGGRHPHGVGVRPDLVHAHAPGPRRGGQRRGRHRGLVAVREGPRRAVRPGQQRCPGNASCDAPTSTGKVPPAERADVGQAGSAAASCARGACRSRGRGRPRCGPGSHPRGHYRVDPAGQLVADLAHHVGVGRARVHVMAVAAPVHHHVGRARPRRPGGASAGRPGRR